MKVTCKDSDGSLKHMQSVRSQASGLGNGSVTRSGWTTGNGSVTKDVTSSYDLRSGDKLEFECMVPSGDWVNRRITVP